MAEGPAERLAEKSAATAARPGIDAMPRNFAAAVFAERIMRRRPASYPSCVYLIQARPTFLFALAGSCPQAERR